MFTPGTTLYFLNVPTIDATGRNVPNFNTAQEQYEYFFSYKVLEVDRMRPLRDSGRTAVIKLPGKPNDYEGITYCMWRNDYSTKWYYAYCGYPMINSDGITYMQLSLDDMQTYLFDMSISRCLIVRTHVTDDAKGHNLVPEDIETGDYIVRSGTQIIDDGATARDWTNYIVVSCSFTPATELEPQTLTIKNTDDTYGSWLIKGAEPVFAGGNIVHGLYQGTLYVAYPMDTTSPKDAQVSLLNTVIAKYQNYGQINRIRVFRNVPRWLVEEYIVEGSGNKNTPIKQGGAVNITEPTGFSFNGETYTPKNNKLYNKEYNYMVLSNNADMNTELYYEDFVNRKPSFSLTGQLSDNPTIMAIPLNHNGLVKDYLNRVMLSDFPTSSYGYSNYANAVGATGYQTLALERQKQNLNYYTDTVSGLANLLSGNANNLVNDKPTASTVGGVIGSAIDFGINRAVSAKNRVFDDAIAIRGMYNHMREPYAISGSANGNIMYALGQYRISVYCYQIKPFYAKLIDNYFTANGYKVNTYGTPNTHARDKWVYIQTGECPVAGPIPVESKVAIAQQFNNGVRFWNKPGTCWLDYTQDNAIVGG